MRKTKEKTNIKFGIALSYLAIVISLLANFFFLRYVNLPGNKQISSQYDLYSFASSIASLLRLLNLGLAGGYIRFATKAEKEGGSEGLKKTNSIYALLLLVSSLLVLAVGGSISLLILSGVIRLSAYSPSQIQLVALFLFLEAANVALSIFASAFNLFLNFRSRFIFARLVSLLFATAAPLIAIPFIRWSDNLLAFSIVHVSLTGISLLIQILYVVFALRYRVSFKSLKGTKHHLKEIFIFTFFVLLMDAFSQIDANLNKILLGFFAPAADGGVNTEAAGSYNTALSIITVVGAACAALFTTFAPKINRAVVNNDKDEVSFIFNRTTEIAILIYFLIFGGFLICGRQFIDLWLRHSRGYVYYIVLALFAINLIPHTAYISLEIQRAYDKHRFRGFLMLGRAALNILGGLLALFIVSWTAHAKAPHYIYYQLAVVLSTSFVLSAIFDGVVMAIYDRKVLGLPFGFFYEKILIYAFLTALPAGATAALFHFVDLKGLNGWVSLILTGSTFVLLFLLTMAIFNRRFVKSLLREKRAKKEIAIPEEDLAIVKKAELAILQDIIRVCDELGVEYFAVGATALGAAKCQGFLPGAEGIEIAMKRQDFDKFIQQAPALLNPAYFVQSFAGDENFSAIIAKVRDSRTVFEEASDAAFGIQGGICVDILPIDNAFDSKGKALRYRLVCALLDAKLKKTIPYSSAQSIALDFISFFCPFSKRRLVRSANKLLRHNKESDRLYLQGAYFAQAMFSSCQRLKFEGVEIKVPTPVDRYLAQAYGDRAEGLANEGRPSRRVYSFDIENVRNIYEDRRH